MTAGTVSPASRVMLLTRAEAQPRAVTVPISPRHIGKRRADRIVAANQERIAAAQHKAFLRIERKGGLMPVVIAPAIASLHLGGWRWRRVQQGLPPVSVTFERHCQECDEPFKTTNVRKVFCARDCERAANCRRQRERRTTADD